MQALRNTLYVLLQLVMTPLYAFAICGCFWLPPRQRNLMCASHTELFIWFAKHLCRIDYEIIGGENIPCQTVYRARQALLHLGDADAGDTLHRAVCRQEGAAVGAILWLGLCPVVTNNYQPQGWGAGDGADDRAGQRAPQ